MADPEDDWAAPGQRASGPAGGADHAPVEPPRYGQRVDPPAALDFPPPAAPIAPPPGPPAPPQAPGAYRPPPKLGLIPLHPLSFGRVLGASFAAIRWNPRATIVPALAVAILQIAITLGGGAALGFNAYDRITNARPADEQAIIAGTVALSIIGVLIIAAISLVLNALLQGIVVLVVARGALGERPGAGAVLRRAARSMRPLVGYALLLALAALVVILVLAAAVTALALAGQVGVIFAVLVGVFGVLGLVVLFVFISVKVAVVPSIIVLERLGIRPAIARSWRLTRGVFWRTLGLIVVVMLMLQFVAQVVSVPFLFLDTFLAGLLAPDGAADGDVASQISTVLVSSLPGTIATTIVAGIGGIAQVAVTNLVYLDARMRREGLDLTLRAVVEGDATDDDPFRTPPSEPVRTEQR